MQPRERQYWDRLRHWLRVPFHSDGVISQFEGYERLAEFDWDGYRSRYGKIARLDLILAAGGDSPNNYRLSKQARLRLHPHTGEAMTVCVEDQMGVLSMGDVHVVDRTAAGGPSEDSPTSRARRTPAVAGGNER